MNLSRLNPMPFLRAAARALRRLPVAKYLKPVWKKALKELVVQDGGDKLQAELLELIRAKTPEALTVAHNTIDRAQERFEKLVRGLPFIPVEQENRILAQVNASVDALEERLRGVLDAGRDELSILDLVNRAFDDFQADVKKRVDEL